MIKKTLHNLIRISLCKNAPKASFCFQAAKHNFEEVINRELFEEEKNPEDMKRLQSQFRQENWAITYNDIQIQLSKQFKTHKVIALINAKTETQDFNQFKDDRFYGGKATKYNEDEMEEVEE